VQLLGRQSSCFSLHCIGLQRGTRAFSKIVYALTMGRDELNCVDFRGSFYIFTAAA
jgi:hypothetical protein